MTRRGEIHLFSKSTSESRICALQTAQRGITPPGPSAERRFATWIRFSHFVVEFAQKLSGEIRSKYFPVLLTSYASILCTFHDCLWPDFGALAKDPLLVARQKGPNFDFANILLLVL